MTEPTYFLDDAAQTAREAETTAANFDNGMNTAGSCAPGIGININQGAVVGEPQQFTLLDQHGDARAAQISQSIGGFPSVPRTGDQPFTWDRSQPSYTPAGAASSGGQAGTLPDATIRFGTLPTQAAKDADTALDGTIIPVSEATLSDIAVGWVASA